MLSIQDKKDNFERVRNKLLLCKYETAVKRYDFVQVVLKIISEEANFVQEESNVFDIHSQTNVCYVHFDSFKRFLIEDGLDFDENTTYDEEIELISDYLTDKLVVINPYFYYHPDRDLFFKNGSVVKVVYKNEESEFDDYHTIPVIPSSDAFEKLNKNEPFALPYVSEKLLGVPEYLFYNNKIYKVSLESLPSNDCYWQAKKEEDSVIELEIDILDLESYEFIYTSNSQFVFLSKKALLNSLKKKKKNISRTPIENENILEESIEMEYEDPKETKIINDFFNYTQTKNLCYSKNDIYNFYTCVRSSQLIILAGMSGTGKTRLPLKFAEYFNMNEKDSTLLFVPVSPAFTEPADILGFLNPNTGIYTSSESRVVEFLKHAEKYNDKMHLIIFDEMNLAQIEFWFAPFISILEKDINERELHLYSESQRCINDEKYPRKIQIGKNVIFVGTINLDETTKNISDRLLDRSFIINLKKETFTNYQAQQSLIEGEDKIEKYNNGDFYQLMPSDTLEDTNYIKTFKDIKQLEFFDKVHQELNKIDSQKGISFRSVKNISLFLKNRPGELSEKLAFDFAFKQTVMKKINGSSENIGSFLGEIDENGDPHGTLTSIFDEFRMVSEFNECRNEVKNKIIELKKYGYAR